MSAIIGRRIVAPRHTLTRGIIEVIRFQFRCLTCGNAMEADEGDVMNHGYTAGGQPYVLTFCSCEADLFVPVTMIEGAP